ncbi:MAG: TonB-dependent receptor [Opitutaceae bacterium]|nr:TonB-dependent receptor [Opitutaceae bacterium]
MNRAKCSLTALALMAAAWPSQAQTVPPAGDTVTPNATRSGLRPGDVETRSTDASGPDEVIRLTPFEVSATADRGYVATETLAGTRIRTNLADVGSAISVYTKEFLADIGATGNATLLQYTTNAEVGGVHSTYAGLGNGTSVDESGTLASPSSNNRVRGLSAADNARDFFVSDIPWDGFNIDRVDIQRGPNSILFGLGKPAGIINASLRNAELRDRNSAEIRLDAHGSQRATLDINKELVDNTLAIRLIGLWDHEKFQQERAFEDDERVYGALRFDPRLFNRGDFHTSVRAKFEHGDIDANRPRTVPPNDHLTPWFLPKSGAIPGMGKLLLQNSYMAEREDTPAIGGDGMGQLRPADPEYNAWIARRGNDQQPYYFIDGTTNQLYTIYGGYMNQGSRNPDGTIRANNGAIIGRRYSAVFYGVNGLPAYATQAKLPGYQYGQYRENTLTDPSIFNFYDTLIDGPNKWEKEKWNSYNVSLSQTGWNDRIGLDLTYDKQEYRRANENLFGAPTIDIDILQNFQDLKSNPNVGRPYVQGSGGGRSYESDREVVRGAIFGEFRSKDVIRNEFLSKLIGVHRFNGVYSAEKYASENRTWNLYATSPAFDTYTGVPLPFNDRPPISMIYLGSSLPSLNSASGANIPGISAPIELNDGSLYHFSSQWNALSTVSPGAAWTVPASLTNVYGTDAYMQASNPANYVGWNTNYYLDILRHADGDQSLTTNAAKALRKTRSYAGTWQSYWWNGALVGTLGWRYDVVRGKDVTAPVTTLRNTLNLSPSVYTLPSAYASELKSHSLSKGAVLHINKLFSRDPLPLNVSVSYNTSDNFEIAGTRRNLYGEVLGNPTGKTEDYGILLSTKDGRYSFRAVKYEASVKDSATQMSNLSMFGDIISYGLRWRNVMLYNLNAYTLDTANGSNEWRYNFDPDTAKGETQEQATARENASIAAWNDIQAHMPAKFYQYWGFTPPSNLGNPDASQVQAYKIWGGSTPQGLTLTSDTVSKGYEFEFTANPRPNWRISFNASKTEASLSNVGGAEAAEFVKYISEKLAGPAGEMRMFSGGPTAQTLLQQWNNTAGSWTLLKLQEGAASSELRKWRYNVITNYTFTGNFLRNVGIGGSYRWQDKIVIGYPVVAVSASSYSFDLSKPYYGPSEDFLDVWLSYERKLSKRIGWKIQLNARNVFGKDELIPISVQPDGHTVASARIAPNREWLLTNTFTF